MEEVVDKPDEVEIDLPGTKAALRVGDRLATPFGVALVLGLDLQRYRIHTDRGDWDILEVGPVDPPGPGQDVVTWLDGPDLEVRTVVDQVSVPCECGCVYCMQMCSVEKRTRTVLIRRHEPRVSCRCTLYDCPCQKGLV